MASNNQVVCRNCDKVMKLVSASSVDGSIVKQYECEICNNYSVEGNIENENDS